MPWEKSVTDERREKTWTGLSRTEMKWNCRPTAPTTDLIRLWSNELKAEPTHTNEEIQDKSTQKNLLEERYGVSYTGGKISNKMGNVFSSFS